MTEDALLSILALFRLVDDRAQRAMLDACLSIYASSCLREPPPSGVPHPHPERVGRARRTTH